MQTICTDEMLKENISVNIDTKVRHGARILCIMFVCNSNVYIPITLFFVIITDISQGNTEGNLCLQHESRLTEICGNSNRNIAIIRTRSKAVNEGCCFSGTHSN